MVSSSQEYFKESGEENNTPVEGGRTAESRRDADVALFRERKEGSGVACQTLRRTGLCLSDTVESANQKGTMEAVGEIRHAALS